MVTAKQKGIYLGDLAANPMRLGAYSRQLLGGNGKYTGYRIGFVIRRQVGAQAPEVGSEIGLSIDGRQYIGNVVESWAIVHGGEPASHVTFECPAGVLP